VSTNELRVLNLQLRAAFRDIQDLAFSGRETAVDRYPSVLIALPSRRSIFFSEKGHEANLRRHPVADTIGSDAAILSCRGDVRPLGQSWSVSAFPATRADLPKRRPKEK
jgi:hypothetical protein